MTRINAHIAPKKLCDSHLVAEYREILRVFKLAKYTDKIPRQFTLGKGHVIFFYDKLKYVHDRFESLKHEIRERGFTPKIEFDESILESKMNLYNDWSGYLYADALIRQRLIERASSMKDIRYYGKAITVEEYSNILHN